MQDNSLLALSGVYHIKERLFTRLLRRHGMDNLSPAQGRILMALREQDDIPVRQLVTLTSLDKSTLSLSLSRMEQFGIVQRVGDMLDRRVVRVKLTEHGKSNLDACAAASEDLSRILYEGIEPEELAVYRRVMDQIFRNVSEAEQESKI